MQRQGFVDRVLAVSQSKLGRPGSDDLTHEE
jgi:hypothetical protein